MTTESKRKVSWSVSVTAAVAMAGAAAVYAADGRYVKSGHLEHSIQKMLISHELDKLRVELAVLIERRNSETLNKKEKTDLSVKESYRRDLVDKLNRLGS